MTDIEKTQMIVDAISDGFDILCYLFIAMFILSQVFSFIRFYIDIKDVKHEKTNSN